jgi:hypothetical protein
LSAAPSGRNDASAVFSDAAERGVHGFRRRVRRAGLLLGAFALNLQVNLFAEDRNRLRGINAYADFVTDDRENLDLHIVRDHDALIRFPS